jgi:hypothetical protein
MYVDCKQKGEKNTNPTCTSPQEPPTHSNVIHNRFVGKPIIFVHHCTASSSSSSHCREVVGIVGKPVEMTGDNIKERNDLMKKRCSTL